jgi:DNA-directed RNA polymerase subunit F
MTPEEHRIVMWARGVKATVQSLREDEPLTDPESALRFAFEFAETHPEEAAKLQEALDRIELGEALTLAAYRDHLKSEKPR